MDKDLRAFLTVLLRAVLPALLLVASVAFFTIPYALGHHPGDRSPVPQASYRHFT